RRRHHRALHRIRLVRLRQRQPGLRRLGRRLHFGPGPRYCRGDTMNLFPFFAWLEASWLGVFVKDKAATFAIIEAMHLMALAVLGGSVLVADLRLLGVALRDVPSNTVSDNAHRLFKGALFVLIATGIPMLAGVATKCYHNPFYWVKMTALAIGIVFVFAL